MGRTTKTILFTSLLILLVAMITGYYFYTKKPRGVKNRPCTAVEAVKLYTLYSNESADAQKKYTYHILEVSDQVANISLNQQQQEVILLKSGTVSAYVNCTMEAGCDHFQPLDKIRVKGICTGIGQSEEELGITADVYLTNCYVIK